MAECGALVVDWVFAGVSVAGESHLRVGGRCEDAAEVLTDPTNKFLILVASDGAGSAPRGLEGAELVASLFAGRLMDNCRELCATSRRHALEDFVLQSILAIRAKLAEKSGDGCLRDFNCTLVAAVLGPNGGVSVHVGDGAILGGSISDTSLGDSERVGVMSTVFSAPENGEYANETFFVTEPDWARHLRVRPLPPLDWIMVCTDGGASLAMQSNISVKPSFVFPVLSNVLTLPSAEKRQEALVGILTDKQADKVTLDDKTILMACRSKVVDLLGPIANYSSQSVVSVSRRAHSHIDAGSRRSGVVPLHAPVGTLTFRNFSLGKHWVGFIILALFGSSLIAYFLMMCIF